MDYVELDPEIIRLARTYLSGEPSRALDDPRVHLLFQDGRSFLQNTRKTYEMIILDLPGPATAQINRFYTREFFELARRRLSGDGVFSFGVASAENYIGPELQDLLSSLHGTLVSVFPTVMVVPGERNIFLASAGPLSIDPASSTSGSATTPSKHRTSTENSHVKIRDMRVVAIKVGEADKDAVFFVRAKNVN